VAVGAPAPAFELTDQHGAPVSLQGVLRERAALVMFYPFAFSSICGGELRELRDALPGFGAAGVQPVCVSCDPMYALRVYADQEGFGFPLLSDFWPHGDTARRYGVFEDGRGCALRGSFLVDRAGAVRWSIINPLREPRPIAGTLAALALAKA
jgi:mycoredoxin-dependent peroxiredoxin